MEPKERKLMEENQSKDNESGQPRSNQPNRADRPRRREANQENKQINHTEGRRVRINRVDGMQRPKLASQNAPDANQSAEAEKASQNLTNKQTNHQDRYLRPSLSQHGARPHNGNERSTTAPRRFNAASSEKKSNFQTSPRAPIGRNPRLNEDRPLVSRVPGSKPQVSHHNQNQNQDQRQISRRRFPQAASEPNGAARTAGLSNPSREENGKPVVLASGTRKLRIIPLGGAGEVGSKNMTVFEYGSDILVVDCGIAFPDKDMLGIDSVIADTTYLEERKGNIRGMVFTHGHEDHIGGVPYIWPKLNCPMYATPLTCGLIQHKLDEAGVKNAPLTVVQAGDKLHFGQISVEMVRLTHSIPDVLGLAIRCPAGLFFYATDWRLEHTPALGKPADWIRVAELGGEGITALFSDSTNVDRPGYSPSEKMIGEAFDRIFQEAKGRVIVAQFSSQINRIQQAINSARKFGRHIAISGRSMETYVNIAMNLGYLKIAEGMLVDIRKASSIDPRKIAILSTGSQGEEFSSLVRISEGEHRHIKLDKTDTVVISASTVPGNESAVDKLIDNLYREGANVIHSKLITDIHVSGHPSRDELKLMFALTKPRFFIPIHGDYHRMYEHGKLAVEMGVQDSNVLLMENGNVVEFDPRGGRISGERIQLNDVMIDGKGIGDVGPIVIRDRQMMGNEGMVTVFLVVKEKTGEMVNSPDIISRGFIYMREAEHLMHKLREEIKKSYANGQKQSPNNWDEIKQSMRDHLSKFLENETGRNPMVIPVITTV
jgi:ribonuclease J